MSWVWQPLLPASAQQQASASVTIPVAAGAISATGYAPSLLDTIPVGAGSGTFTGYAPTLTVSEVIAVGAGSITSASSAPTLAQTENQWITPAVGAHTLTGYAPTLAQTENQWITPATGAVTVTGYAQALAETLPVPAGSITTEGYVSDVVLPGSILVAVGSGTFEGYAPELIDTAPAVSYSETPAGGGRRRGRRKYHVEIDGETFVVDSIEEAQALLDRATQLASVAAEKSAEQIVADALRRARRIGKVESVSLKAPRVKGDPELNAALEASQRAIEQAYEDAAINAEIQALMAFEAELDDEDILLLL